MGCGSSKSVHDVVVPAVTKPTPAAQTTNKTTTTTTNHTNEPLNGKPAVSGQEKTTHSNSDPVKTQTTKAAPAATPAPKTEQPPQIEIPDIHKDPLEDDDSDLDLDALDPAALAELEQMESSLRKISNNELKISMEHISKHERAISMGSAYKGMSLEFAFPPVVISGVSGSGKRTLAKRIVQDYPDIFGVAIGHTTRKPRENEKNGADYYFVDHSVMEELIKGNKFVQTTSIFGNTYGVTRAAIEDVGKAGKICVMNMEIEGVISVKDSKDISSYKPRYILVCPPSVAELDRRLNARGDAADTIEDKKLKLANYQKYAERTSYWDLVIINENLDIAYDQLKGFLQKEIADRDEKMKHEDHHMDTSLDTPSKNREVAVE
eukprot:Sdes_comp15466_c0_seq1m4369